MSRIGVITFPGSLDDRDAQRAIRLVGAEPVALWHGDHDLHGVDAVVLPGGFSYGDYLRAGAIASHAPIMAEVIEAAGRGVPVLGICNGFQMLAEARLLPGAHTRNAHQQFIRRDQKLRVENASTAWTNEFAAGDEIVIPLKNADGRFVADDDTIARIEGNGQVVFRYVDVNPNGSMNDIAGVSNERGNVVGLMPHPEHATEPGFGPDMPEAMRSGTDGLRFFTSALAALISRLMTPLRLFRLASIAEAITWTLLIGGLVLRATVGLDIAVTIGGGIHGFVFLAYGAVALITAINQRWSFGVTVLAVGSAVIPYATIPVELWMSRTGRLAGDWRRDPAADRHWLDGLVRWAVGRPVLLAVLVTVGVVALFVVLLVAGPPEVSS